MMDLNGLECEDCIVFLRELYVKVFEIKCKILKRL